MLMNTNPLRLMVLLLAISLTLPAPLHAQEKPAQEKPAPAPLALSMHDAIRLALAAEGNPTVEIAVESVRAAEARRRDARSGLLPQIDTTVTGQNQILNLQAGGFGSIQLPGGAGFPKSVGPFDTIDARVHVRQNLFDWASINRNRAGKVGIETAKVESDDARDRVATQVAKLYLAARRATEGLGPIEALVASVESTLKEVANRGQAGEQLGIDVSHARLRLAVEKQHILESRMEKTRAGMELLSAMNRDLDTPLDLTDSLTFAPQDLPKPEQALATALQSRSDVAAQRRKIQEARLQDSAIHSERIPSVVGYANVGSLGTTIDNSIGTYDVGISLRIPVFDGGRREARRDETQSTIRQEELRATQLEKQIALEIRQALIKLDMTRGQIEIADQEIEVAHLELDHRNRRHDQGLGSQLEVLDAQATLAQATDTRIVALYAWNEARIELMQAMGTIRKLAQ
jgi:outer membrane protein